MPEVPLGKQLAHTDKTVRDAAVRNLSAYLSRGSEEGAVDDEAAESSKGKRENGSAFTQLSDAEMAKLWKGLFYCTSLCAILPCRASRTCKDPPT